MKKYHENQEWNRTIKHFGEVNAGVTLEFTFEYYGDWTYKKHNASCGCVTSKWNNNKLTASFNTKNKSINDAMRKMGIFHSESSKTITVEFEKDGKTKSIPLSIQAIIYPSDYPL